ncbi:hypothetical protein ACIQ9R_30300 [Streptomyces sp. NPDC094447]|uniref:hypothetical protein n=1 Tax=Streptomyces sp. NPDC094447 TaxID=3366062 RepID=UPI0037FA793D
MIDLVLLPAPGHGWAEYFAAVDEATRAVAAALGGEQPTGYRCACPVPAPDVSLREGVPV